MSYIDKITVGGKTYNLAPSLREDLVYIEPTAGSLVGRPARLISIYDGKLTPYLASAYAGEKTEILFAVDVKDRGPAWGLGANMYGAMGVYVYTGSAGNPMIRDGDTISRLGRLGLSDNGAIGVYVTGQDGIYTNGNTDCISLKLKTDRVTLQSGEQLGIYINDEGFLELIKV